MAGYTDGKAWLIDIVRQAIDEALVYGYSPAGHQEIAQEVVQGLLATDGDRVGWLLDGRNEQVLALDHIHDDGDGCWIVDELGG